MRLWHTAASGHWFFLEWGADGVGLSEVGQVDNSQVVGSEDKFVRHIKCMHTHTQASFYTRGIIPYLLFSFRYPQCRSM